MENNAWSEIECIFAETLELPEADRAAFLARACNGNKTLQREVESLLAAHQQAQGFLASSAASQAKLQFLPGSLTITAAHRIGPYQLRRELGQGGMGTVWLAERVDEQYKQQVAIKLLKAGANHPDIAHRLRHERQILADLNHPNIARLLDGGTTDNGQPYLVMEYIEGVPIDAYCQLQQLPLLARLRLFRMVCSAVQYAHQHLIIHRDLKPANILVAADGTPKLLDFGIAKLLQPDLAQSYQTQAGQTPMTPAYASPEQVRSEKLTTTSDVYSLGVVLYELLTGHSPYQLKEKTFNEMMRAIIEQEPERPSQAVSRHTVPSQSRTTENAEPNTATRSLPEPMDKLRRHLSGDLDAIVLKALRKEPTARYSSVEQLSDDLQRYLDGLPTLARKGSFTYRAVKYVRRYKVPVATVALILLSLLGGIGATAHQAQIARAEQAKAETQRLRAEQAFAVANEQRRRAEQALAEVKAERTRAENALITAEQRRQQAEVARTEATKQRAVAEEERNVAQAQRKLVDEQRQRAESQELSNRRLLYTSRIGLAQQAWDNSNIGRMRELLDFYLPQVGEPDFRGFEWYHLWRLCHREVKTFADTGSFDGLAYSPDGSVLVTQSVTLNSSSMNTSEITFRDTKTWQTLSSRKYLQAGSMGTIAVASNSDKFAIKFSSEGIRVFSFSDYKEHLYIDGLRELRSVAISPGGDIIAAGSYSGGIQFFDATSGKEIRVLHGHQGQINSLAFSPDGQMLASSSFDQTVRLWNVKTGIETRLLKKGGAVPNTVLFTPNGNSIIAACGGEMKVWETPTGKEIATRPLGAGRPFAAISPDGRILATGDSQPVIRLWDTQTWQEINSIKGHGNEIRALTFTPDGTGLASGSLDQTARIWNLGRNEKETPTLTDPDRQANFSKAIFTPNGKQILSVSATISGSPSVSRALLWDSTSGQKLFQVNAHTRPPNVSGIGIMLAGSPDGRLFATGGVDSLVRVWNAVTGQEIRTFSGLSYFPTSLAFSPDNKLLAAGSQAAGGQGVALVYDIATGRQIMNGTVPLSMINAITFLSDGKTLITGGIDRLIRFWDIATGQETRNFLCGQKAVSSMAISPDGNFLATAGLDSTVAIWEVKTGRQLFVLKGHSSNVKDVSFSPDGSRLASGSADNTVKLWDLVTGQELITFKDTGGFVGSVMFSPDGKQLLAACGRSARIWPAATEGEVSAKMQ